MQRIIEYEEALQFDVFDTKNLKILTAKEASEGDYTRLDNYLEEVFIPNNIKYKTKKNIYEEDEAYILLFDILRLDFSRIEIDYIIKYLKKKNIKLHSKKSIVVNQDNDEVTLSNNCFWHIWKDMLRYEPLKEEEQKELFKKYQETHDKEIRNQLILGNSRLLVKILLIVYKEMENIAEEDFSNAYVALIKAIDNYDVTKGYKFSSYAYSYIYKYLYRNNRRRVFDLYPNFLVAISNFKDNNIDLVEEVLEYLFERGEIKEFEYEEAKRSLIRFLKESYVELKNYILDMNIDNDELYYNMDYLTLKNKILEILDTLSRNEKEDILLRFGFDGEYKSCREVGEIKNVRHQVVHRRIVRALGKIAMGHQKELKIYSSKEMLDAIAKHH